MGVSSALWIVGPFVSKLLIDSMTRTIQATFAIGGAGTGTVASLGMWGAFKATMATGSQVKGGLTLTKMVAGLSLFGLIRGISSTIYQKMILK